MVGKASLIVILGFSVIFGIASQYWNRTSNSAVENFIDYYDSTAAHNAAVNAANLVCDSIFQNPQDTTWASTAKVCYFNNGDRAWIQTQMSGGVGRLRNVNILTYDTVVAYYRGRAHYIQDTVKVVLTPYAFSRFAWFTSNENSVNWVTGDTLTGPLQTNKNLYVQGAPVIIGTVTIGGVAMNRKSQQYPGTTLSTWESYGDTLHDNSFKNGVIDSLPSVFDSNYTIKAATKTFSNSNHTGSSYAYDVYLTFDTTNGGSVTESDTTRYTTNSGSTWKKVDSSSAGKMSISSIANSKTGESLILVNDGDVHVSGVVNGDVTVVATQPSSNHRISSTSSTSYFSSSVDGNILISSSITYKDPNAPNDGSTQMLGLVANNSVMLTTQANAGDVTIDAAVFALDGSFSYQDYNGSAHSSYRGYIDVNGSVIQNTRGAVGQVMNGPGSGPGYLKRYRYDSRFRYQAPPGFPLSRNYVVLSWKE